LKPAWTIDGDHPSGQPYEWVNGGRKSSRAKTREQAKFRRAYREIKADPAKIDVGGYCDNIGRQIFLSKCENAIKWSADFVEGNLKAHMFKGKSNAGVLAKSIVKSLSNYTRNKSHSRHLHFDACKKMGLNVSLLEDDQDLQDLVLTVHHCYMHALMNTASFKMIENHNGLAFVKQQHQVQMQQKS
jgi:hypothetical protein